MYIFDLCLQQVICFGFEFELAEVYAWLQVWTCSSFYQFAGSIFFVVRPVSLSVWIFAWLYSNVRLQALYLSSILNCVLFFVLYLSPYPA